MPNALAVIGVALCLSLLEGIWGWLFIAAAAEVSDQAPPPFLFIGLILFIAWLAARVTAVAHVPTDQRRWLLTGAGIALAATSATIAAGRVHPLQLLVGSYDPDYRGVGVVVLVVSA